MQPEVMSTVQKFIKLICTKSGQIDTEQVSQACSLLNKCGVIALPTDTLYGIAAKADDSNALERIYNIKNRDKTKPLAVCLADVDQIDEVADIGKTKTSILRSILPGPVTVVLRRSEKLNRDLNPGIETIGVRVPDHNFIMAISAFVGPLALTSANRSGEKSSLLVDDFQELWDDLDCIFDAGPIKALDLSPMRQPRLGSTVIDLSNDEHRVYKVIREGCALNRTINVLTRFGYRLKQ